LGTPSGVAAFGAALTGLNAAAYGALVYAAGEAPGVARWLGLASGVAWTAASEFSLVAALFVASPIGPETPPGGDHSREVTNQDGSVTVTDDEGNSLTLGPVSRDAGTTMANPDGSVTVTDDEGNSLTLGPATFGETGGMETGDSGYGYGGDSGGDYGGDSGYGYGGDSGGGGDGEGGGSSEGGGE
jgi:hypothetical protein